MRRIALVLAILALALAPAGLAQAQLGGPNVPDGLTPPPAPAPVQNDLDNEGLSGFQQALIFAGAGLILGVIAFVIVRDARRSAPGGDRRGTGAAKAGGGAGAKAKAKGAAAVGATAGGGSSASAIRARERQQAKRAKAKARAVREQRKRNRPR